MSGPTSYYEIRWRPSDSDGEWAYMTVPPDTSTVSIKGTDREKSYVIQARAVGPSGLKSVWVNISHTVAGNTPPEAPSSVTALGVADGVKLVCDFVLPLAADVDVCVERATAFAGPFTEVLRARALTIIVPEKVDGLFYYRLRTRNFKGQYSTYSGIVDARPAVVNTSLDSMVLNPNFDQGFDQWEQVDSGFYLESGVNALSGNSAFKVGGTSGLARVTNSKRFGVKPGQVIFTGAMMAAVSSPNGTAYVSLVFRDITGAYLQDKSVFFTDGNPINSSVWRSVSKRIVAPVRAAFAQISGVVNSHTSGSWGFDNFRCAIVADNYAGVASGESLLPNHNFSANVGDWPTSQALLISGDPVTDGWYLDQVTHINFPNTMSIGLENNSSDSNLRQLFIGDGNVSGSTMVASSQASALARTYERLAVNPGEKLLVEHVGRIDQGNARPSGINYTAYMGLWFFTKDGTSSFAFQGYQSSNFVGPISGSTVATVPTGAAYAVGVTGVIWANANGTSTFVPWATCHFRAQSLRIRRQATLDDGVVIDGPVYGRTGNVDLIVDAGVRRIGLNVRGSRNILGGARNARSSLVGGFSAVRTAVALSANSSGQVSINAHNLEISGETVVYNAVTNAVIGLTVGVTYVIFTLDPYLDGGTRTYFAQTTVLSAQQAGDGAVFMGNITIPSSGSSTGGDSGTGGPGSFCVDSETMLPDGRYLKNIRLGDLVECVNVTTGETGFYPLLGMSFGEEECFRLSEQGGCSVIQSRSTPMDLPGGQICMTPDMYGKPIVTRTAEGVAKSIVWDLQYVGVRRVLKPNFGNRMFFGGERAAACIATHNLNNKP